MQTKLRNCKVPWAISSSGGVTLIHEETDVAPQCRVVLPAFRLNDKEGADLRRIDLVFDLAYFTRTTPHHDSQSPSHYGFEVVDKYDGDVDLYLNWREQQWAKNGVCPDSGFYVAESSDWLESVPDFYKKNCKHYLFDGRDGHVELLASKYRWAEWMISKHRHREWLETWPLDDAVFQSSAM